MIRLTSPRRRPTPSWHQRFLAMLPAIETHARLVFRHLGPEAREDAVQETIANALVAFVRLVHSRRPTWLIRRPWLAMRWPRFRTAVGWEIG